MADWPEFSATDLLRLLVRHGVDFVVVGGIAMVIHGSARLTQDLDICFAADAANLSVLGTALSQAGRSSAGSTRTCRSCPTPERSRSCRS